MVAKLSFVAFGLLAFALLGEIAARTYYSAVHDAPFWGPIDQLDPALGWEGRRVFGDPGTSRRRLLVLGDSMTAGRGVADADLYPTVLGALLGVEVFAYGGGGYGTLQERLVLERYLPQVKPDLVLLQVTSNDFTNNSHALERASYTNANMRVRPYLEGDTVVWRFPSRIEPMGWLTAHSRLAYRVVMDAAQAGAVLNRHGLLRGSDDEVAVRGLGWPPFREAVATTERILSTMQARLGTTRLFVFTADDPQPPYLDTWRAICARQGVPLFDAIPARIVAEERALGASIRPDGAHWDPRGHRLVAAMLARWLADYVPGSD